MIAMLRLIDRKSHLMVLLFLFWAIFWGLNGLDKFYNGSSGSNTATGSARAELIDPVSGDVAFTFHPIEPHGFFGVTRDKKMIGYYNRIGMGEGIALFSLYALAVGEVMLGISFGALFIWSMLPYRIRDRRYGLWTLFQDRTIHRISFKGGIVIFIIFALGDILFGDRVELWEHGTYMVLCLITYDMWYRTDEFITERERHTVHVNPD